MDVKTPRHTYDAESDQVIVESVGREDYETERVNSLSPEFANKVDPDELTDVLASNALVGNVDVKSDNVMIGEDGGVQPFDYDWTDTQDTAASLRISGNRWTKNTLSSIDALRDHELGVTVDDVYDRAGEMAHQMEATGMTETVAQSAEKYDEYFKDEVPGTFNPVGDRVREHVQMFAEDHRN